MPEPAMSDAGVFAYVAVGADGRRMRGEVSGGSEQAAFDSLRRQGLSPVRLRRLEATVRNADAGKLRDRESAEVLLNLADLLGAGADMRASLNVLLLRSQGSRIADACQRLLRTISAGEALDVAFSRVLAPRHGFVAALIAAGEAAGDLPQAMRRAGEMLEASMKLRQQLVGALAYPAFVLTSTLAAAAVILLAVVPSLEPMVDESSNEGTSILSTLLAASRLLRDHGAAFSIGLGLLIALLWLMGRLGLLARPLDTLLLTGPWRRVTGALCYGGFSVSLGVMLSAGAPTSEALRLSIRGVPSSLARDRLQAVFQAVRQGVALSEALHAVKGFPPTIVRLVSVGESTGALGAMLQRSGKLEEEAALRQLQAVTRLLGPLLIVLLGGLIGLMMAGLLSGVAELGEAALR